MAGELAINRIILGILFSLCWKAAKRVLASPLKVLGSIGLKVCILLRFSSELTLLLVDDVSIYSTIRYRIFYSRNRASERFQLAYILELRPSGQLKRPSRAEQRS